MSKQIVIVATWTDDQCGPMWLEVHRISSVEEAREYQGYTYCFYKTELDFNDAQTVMIQNEEDAYGGDLSEHGIYYLDPEPEEVWVDGFLLQPTWQEDEAKELELIKEILEGTEMHKLKANADVKDFSEVTAADYKSMESSNLIRFFYPWAAGLNYIDACSKYQQLVSENTAEIKKEEQKDAPAPHRSSKRKKLNELTREEYKSLHSSGLFWEIFPEATGDFDKDCIPEFVEFSDYIQNENTEHIRMQLETMGLAESIIRDCEDASYEHHIVYRLDTKTNEIKVVSIDGKKVEE